MSEVPFSRPALTDPNQDQENKQTCQYRFERRRRRHLRSGLLRILLLLRCGLLGLRHSLVAGLLSLLESLLVRLLSLHHLLLVFLLG